MQIGYPEGSPNRLLRFDSTGERESRWQFTSDKCSKSRLIQLKSFTNYTSVGFYSRMNWVPDWSLVHNIPIRVYVYLGKNDVRYMLAKQWPTDCVCVFAGYVLGVVSGNLNTEQRHDDVEHE